MPEFAVKLNSNHFVIGLGENTILSARERALAETARIEAAASAAYAESMTGPTYASTATGLAATSDGQGFAVDNGDGTVTVYLNDGGVAVEQRTLATTAYLASQDGAKAIGVKQRGASALLRTAEDALRDIPTRAGYSTTAASIAAAVADDFVVGVTENLTVNIPSDAATLQIALDRLTPLNRQCTITLNIESGHTLSVRVELSGGDYSQFRIVSEDATVPVGFNGGTFIGSNGVKMPTLACLIDAASQTSGTGISLDASFMTIEPGAGAKNCFGNGLSTFNGCIVQANGSIFSGCARSLGQNAGITSWASFVSADGADCSNSGGYGCQAAHGGVLNFKGGNASNARRHGIRATDAALVDADGATANNCGADGDGANVRAYEGGMINFVNGIANGNQATSTSGAALFAFGAGSFINARLATSTGNAKYGVWCEGGARVNTVGGTIAGATAAFRNVDSLIVSETIGETNGVYTPAVTDTSNLTGTPTASAQWSRVGNVVTVSGQITGVASTASGNTRFSLSLPLPSNLVSAFEATGAGVFYTATLRSVASAIYGDATTDRATFNWNSPASSTGQAMSFTFTYLYRAP